VQTPKRRMQFTSRPGITRPNVTAAVGLEETVGRQRARRSSLFTQTVIWVTGLLCLAFLLGSLAQAWSNSHLIQQVQIEQQRTQQLQDYNTHLKQLVNHYNDRFVIESEARQELGYIRPGEHAVVISAPVDNGQPQPSLAPPSLTQEGFWQAWWNVFFGN
jgi:cell division protein FtsB